MPSRRMLKLGFQGCNLQAFVENDAIIYCMCQDMAFYFSTGRIKLYYNENINSVEVFVTWKIVF